MWAKGFVSAAHKAHVLLSRMAPWESIAVSPQTPWKPVVNVWDPLNFKQTLGGGNSNIFVIFTPNLGEMIQFDGHIFQMGWFNHQLEQDVFFCFFSRWSIF